MEGLAQLNLSEHLGSLEEVEGQGHGLIEQTVEVETSLGMTPEIVINTKGSCFICFQSVSEGPQSFQEIYRYLKINWRQICTDYTFKSRYPLKPVEKSELRLSLCDECGGVTNHFKELQDQLQDIKKRMDSCIQTVADKMALVDENGERKEEFWKMMEDEEDESPHVDVVKKLRERAITKVSSAKDKQGKFRASKIKILKRLPQQTFSLRPIRRKRQGDPRPSADKPTCRVCSKTFNSQQTLRRHLFVHLAHVQPYKCPYCPRKFKVNSMLQAHLRDAHKRDQPRTVGTRVVITRTEENQSEDPGQVDQPSAPPRPILILSSPSSASLPASIIISPVEYENVIKVPPPKKKRVEMPPEAPEVHRVVKIYKRTTCKYCDLPFLTFAGLKRHYEKSHNTLQDKVVLIHGNDVKQETHLSYKCVLCRTNFPGEISLREHQKVCTVKTCPKCHLTFSTSAGIISHMNDAHTKRRKRKAK